MAAKKEDGRAQSSSKAENKKKRKEVKAVEETAKHDQSPETKPKKRKRDAEQVGESPPKKHKSEKKEKKDKKEKSIKSKKSKAQRGTEELEIDVNLPAPPSKKALRLQKKGKPVPPVAESSQPPTTDEPPKAQNTVHPDRKNLIKREPPRAEFCVWIGNLAYSTDGDGLRTWLTHGLAKVGDEEITRVNLPVNPAGQSKGYFSGLLGVVDSRFAYVDLKTQEARDAIISRSEQVLDGRRLLIKNGSDFTGRPTEKTPRYHVQATMPQQGPKPAFKEYGGQESRAGNFGRKFQEKGEKVKKEGGRVED